MKKNNFKILIVDDEPGIRTFFQDFCAIYGYKTDCASNGINALELIRHNGSYDLAIVDYQMPEMNGLEFVKQAKEHLPHLPIIAMSAWDDVEDPLIKAGAYLFLRKPFDPRLLENEIALIARDVLKAQKNKELV